MSEIIDTHSHLEQIENLKEAIINAVNSGITGIIAVGVDYSSNQKILELSQKFLQPKIYPALGIHPTEIKPEEIEIALNFIEKNISQLVAIGEIGLDYWFKTTQPGKNQQLQKDVFISQLQLAKKYFLPVIIHSRGAWNESYEIARRENITTAVFHWYSGPLDVLEKIIQTGYFISASPALEYSQQHRQAVENAPLENILVETDSPVRYRDKQQNFYTSQPKDILRTIKTLAEIKKIPPEKIIDQTTVNAKKIFNL